jgi:4-methylaminobutanoate oxidase (formaldehyde-forming)
MFSVMTAAVQPVHDRDWLERLAREIDADVEIRDATAETAVLSVMGPQSRSILATVTDTDLGNEAFPFGTWQRIEIAGKRVRAQRITYVGELGWELHVAADDALTVFDTVLEAGEPHGLRLAGTMAMNSLRVEKGYVSWGHDVSRDDTPLEAGLSFTIDWDKPDGFLGQVALLAARERGLRKRLIAFVLEDAEPVLWGHEPILRSGEVVGFTSSGSYGHSLGAAVGLGYVHAPEGQVLTRGWVEEGEYAIEVAGERYAAQAHWRAPYDSERARILA